MTAPLRLAAFHSRVSATPIDRSSTRSLALRLQGSLHARQLKKPALMLDRGVKLSRLRRRSLRRSAAWDDGKFHTGSFMTMAGYSSAMRTRMSQSSTPRRRRLSKPTRRKQSLRDHYPRHDRKASSAVPRRCRRRQDPARKPPVKL